MPDDRVAVPAVWVAEGAGRAQIEGVKILTVEDKPRIPNPLIYQLEQKNLL
jgi:hypothetical protein